MATLELDVDVCPCRIRLFPQFYKPVIESNSTYEKGGNRE